MNANIMAGDVKPPVQTRRLTSSAWISIALTIGLVALLELLVFVNFWVVVWIPMVLAIVFLPGLAERIVEGFRAHGESAPNGDEPAIEPELAALDQACRRWSEHAASEQTDYLRLGRRLALISPFAVLLLTIQIATHRSHLMSTMLVAGEVACLIWIWFTVGKHVGPTKGWILARLRAELLRRELFLARARVGPYLNADVARQADKRKTLLASEHLKPLEMLPLATSGESWRDQLEDSRFNSAAAAPGAPRTDLTRAMEAYRDQRLRDQVRYYAQRQREYGHCEEGLEDGLRLVLMGSIIAAIVHLCLVWLLPQPAPPTTAAPTMTPSTTSNTSLIWLEQVVTVFAITLPTVALAIQSLRALHEWRRLSLAYREQAQALEHLRAKLQDIIDGRSKDGGSPEFAFQRLVLRAEELFAAELHQWYVLVRAESMSA